MRIKLDENLPGALVGVLSRLGHETDSVESEGLVGAPDHAVWAAAQAEGRFLITQDLDFSNIHLFAPGSHHGILVVRLKNPSRRALRSYVELLAEAEDLEGWVGCLVVASDLKIRVRRPGPKA